MAPPEMKKSKRAASTVKKGGRIEKPKKTAPTREKSDDTAGYKVAEPTLLGIPRELRDQIYEEVIGGNEINIAQADPEVLNFTCIVEAGAYNAGAAAKSKWDELFNLSLTCRQLNVETKDLPYKLSIWANDFGTVFGEFLARLKGEKKRLISTVSFGFLSYPAFFIVDWCEKYTLPEELEDCTGIKTVISRVTLGAGQKRMVEEFAEARGLKLVHETHYHQRASVFDNYNIEPYQGGIEEYWEEAECEGMDDEDDEDDEFDASDESDGSNKYDH